MTDEEIRAWMHEHVAEHEYDDGTGEISLGGLVDAFLDAHGMTECQRAIDIATDVAIEYEDG